jgi:general nucleoside transport system permease protein
MERMNPAIALRATADSPRRQYILAVAYLMVAVGIVWFLAAPTRAGTMTALSFNAQGTTTLPQWIVPTRTAAYVMAAICACLGGVQVSRIGVRHGAWILGLVVGAFVVAFLIWATRDASLDTIGLIENSLLRAVPITLGALSGVLCERAGVINVAIEGQMLMAAFFSTLIGSVTHSAWIGLLSAAVVGGLMGYILALLCLRYRVDQVIGGFVLNIFATGVTSYLAVSVLEANPDLNNPGTLPNVSIPGLSTLPVVGQILFANNVFVYIMAALVILVHVALYYTRWGLRVRAVGEHPVAAETVGIDPIRIRYFNVMLGGVMSGLGGAYFTLGSVGRFDQNLTAGRGFIALVAVIFGGWNPIGAFLAALVFGFADSLQTVLGIMNVNIPTEFLLMVPYLATIFVVAGVVGRTRGPAADGQPFFKD